MVDSNWSCISILRRKNKHERGEFVDIIISMEESLLPPSSDLPPELSDLIVNRLATEIDILRFRSVCSSWRQASLPSSYAVCPYLLTLNDFPIPRLLGDGTPDSDPLRSNPADRGASLRRKTIFHIIPLRPSYSRPNSKLQFKKMFCSSQFMYDEEAVGWKLNGKLNLLDFQIKQVAEFYMLEFPYYPCRFEQVRKIIVSPDSNIKNHNNDVTIVALRRNSTLAFAKHGDDFWTVMDEVSYNYDDLIVFKKNIYAVNRNGQIFRIKCSLSMELVKIISTIPQSDYTRDPKHFVECRGELYVVIRLMSESLAEPKQVIGFKVYRLELNEGIRWVDVENLGNYSFVLMKDFSFSIDEGVEPNCIYFNHVYDCYCWSSDPIAAVFDLKQTTVINLV